MDLAELISTASFDSGRTNLLKSLVETTTVSPSGLLKVLKKYDFDSGRNQAVELIAPKLTSNLDGSTIRDIMEAYSFDSGRNKALKILVKYAAPISAEDVLVIVRTFKFDSGSGPAAVLLAGLVGAPEPSKPEPKSTKTPKSGSHKKSKPKSSKESGRSVPLEAVVKEKMTIQQTFDLIESENGSGRYQALERLMKQKQIDLSEVAKYCERLSRLFDWPKTYQKAYELLGIDPAIAEGFKPKSTDRVRVYGEVYTHDDIARIGGTLTVTEGPHTATVSIGDDGLDIKAGSDTLLGVRSSDGSEIIIGPTGLTTSGGGGFVINNFN